MRALTTGDSTMPRPRKARFYCGVELKPNLYAVPSRPGYWRYVRPDGSSRCFSEHDVKRANEIADANNAKRTLPPDSLTTAVEQYILHREKLDKDLLNKDSWRNRKYALRAFGNEIETPVYRISRDEIKSWWEGLTYYQQKLRKSECRRLWGWMMGEGLSPLPYNPFTTDTSMPMLMNSGVPEKARQRLTRDDFWAIYASAQELGYEGLQIAMGLSLTTFMREGDICSLKLCTNLESDLLKLVVGKSLAQRGSIHAARLQWDIGNHRLVKSLLAKSRELGLKNYRCPFVISHKPIQRRPSKTKEHSCQILPRRLIAQFAEARDHAGMNSAKPGCAPTFHEVRSLADKLAKEAGYDIKAIQQAMAHESVNTTKSYLDGHELPFDTVSVVFDEEMIGGKF